METTFSNPYFHMATIRTANMFFGRRNLLRSFYEAIVNRQSVSLVGPRHIGKSSFLWCVGLPEKQAQFPYDLQRNIFVPLDLREYLYKTSDDFFQNVSKEIILQSRKIPDLTLQAEGRGEEAFSFILDQIKEQGFYPVLLLDAFDNVTLNKHFGPEFFSFLRAHATMGQVSYVTATIAPLYELSHRGIVDSPFFNIFYTYTLEALTSEEAEELIRVPAQKAGVPFTDEEVAWVIKMAGRHPFFIQRVCHILFDEKMQQEKGEVDMQRARNMAYKDLKPHFQDSWDHLTEERQALLQDEAQQKDRQYRKLPELSESAFFRQFVRYICRIGLFSMNAEELENALDKMSDSRALGETNLRLLKTVSQRLSNENATSTVERGIAVREILNEAFERLRGPRVRSDSDSGWVLYNILYYRFFKHHMKNEQIAAHLGISVRQYFRYRRKAIEELLDVLLEMETLSDSEVDVQNPYLNANFVIEEDSQYLRTANIVRRIKNSLESLQNHIETDTSDIHGFTDKVEKLLHEFTSSLGLGSLNRQESEVFSLFLLNTGVAFENLQLPNPLLILATSERALSEYTIEQVRRLLINQYKAPIALLLLFTDAKALLQTKRRLHKILRNVHALDVVVFNQSDLLEIVSAREPERILRRIVLSQVNLTLLAPYTINGPTPPHFFFGREHELREIAHRVNRVSYIIVGGRRIGKTSIMKCLHRIRLPAAGFRTIYYDCSITPSYEVFLDTYLTISDWGSDSLDQSITFGELFRKIPDDKPLVLLLDEIDKLLPVERKTGWPLFNVLRALISSGRLQVVLSGERTLREALRDSSSPLYNFGSVLLIGRLDEAAVEELITKPMKQLEIELVKEKAIVDYIWEFSSGHPNVVQRLCRRLIELLNSLGRRRITLNDVKELVQDPKFQRDDFLNTYWEKATLLERIISLLMAQTNQQIYTLRDIRNLMNNQLGLVGLDGQEPSGIVVDNALNRLTDLRGILRSTPHGYMFDVTAFPKVVARSDVVTIDDLFDVYRDAYRKYGDLTLEEVTIKETEP